VCRGSCPTEIGRTGGSSGLTLGKVFGYYSFGEEATPTRTMKPLFSVKDLMKDNNFRDNPRFVSFVTWIWWFIFSYIPSKSRKAATRVFFFYRHSFMVFIKETKATVREWCLLKLV
jgi:hypothetical protein